MLILFPKVIKLNKAVINHLSIPAVCDFGVSAQFRSKKLPQKIDSIHKDFKLYQVFMHNFLCENVSILPLYKSLTKEIVISWSKGIDKF